MGIFDQEPIEQTGFLFETDIGFRDNLREGPFPLLFGRGAKTLIGKESL